MDRIGIVRSGVDAGVIDSLVVRLGLTKERLLGGLGVAAPTVNRRLRDQAPVSATDSERVVGLAQILARVVGWGASDDAVREHFDAGTWLGTWLSTPNPALGGQLPLMLLDTSDGRQLVDELLGSMESGAYL